VAEPRLVPLTELHPIEWNPRTIRTDRFQNLCQSVQADPEFLRLRPVLAQSDGAIYAGNMRYRAAEHLKLRDIWAVIEDVPDKLAKERAIRDNQQWGEWQEDQLSELLAGLHEQGSALDILGFEDTELNKLLSSVGLAEPETDRFAEWQGMPEYESEDQSAAYKAIVNFASEEDMKAFEKLIGQQIPRNSRSVWYPPQERSDSRNFAYVAESAT